MPHWKTQSQAQLPPAVAQYVPDVDAQVFAARVHLVAAGPESVAEFLTAAEGKADSAFLPQRIHTFLDRSYASLRTSPTAVSVDPAVWATKRGLIAVVLALGKARAVDMIASYASTPFGKRFLMWLDAITWIPWDQASDELQSPPRDAAAAAGTSERMALALIPAAHPVAAALPCAGLGESLSVYEPPADNGAAAADDDVVVVQDFDLAAAVRTEVEGNIRAFAGSAIAAAADAAAARLATDVTATAAQLDSSAAMHASAQAGYLRQQVRAEVPALLGEVHQRSIEHTDRLRADVAVEVADQRSRVAAAEEADARLRTELDAKIPELIGDASRRTEALLQAHTRDAEERARQAEAKYQALEAVVRALQAQASQPTAVPQIHSLQPPPALQARSVLQPSAVSGAVPVPSNLPRPVPAARLRSQIPSAAPRACPPARNRVHLGGDDDDETVHDSAPDADLDDELMTALEGMQVDDIEDASGDDADVSAPARGVKLEDAHLWLHPPAVWRPLVKAAGLSGVYELKTNYRENVVGPLRDRERDIALSYWDTVAALVSGRHVPAQTQSIVTNALRAWVIPKIFGPRKGGAILAQMTQRDKLPSDVRRAAAATLATTGSAIQAGGLQGNADLDPVAIAQAELARRIAALEDRKPGPKPGAKPGGKRNGQQNKGADKATKDAEDPKKS